MAAQSRGEPFDPGALTDDELYEVVLERLREHPGIDAESIDVAVSGGEVTLAGRVGSDGEVEVAGQLLSDVLGVPRLRNELVVDVLRRGEMPEAADDAVRADLEVDDQAGEGSPEQSDTAAHLSPDLEAETFGTHDASQAVEEGATYVPPDRPRGDGYGSRERH
jgi:hypothetical protein